jgi:hypothetical protein
MAVKGGVGKLIFLRPRKIQPSTPPILTEIRGSLVTPTPQGGRLGSVDFIPNLLVTTLAIVSVALPPGQQAHASAPQAKYQVQNDTFVNRLVLQPIPQVPASASMFSIGGLNKYVPQVDVYPNLVLHGSNQPPPGRQLDVISAAVKYNLGIDPPPNRLPLFQPALPPGQRLDAGVAIGKSPVYLDTYPNLALRGSNQPPAGQQVAASAPQGKYQVQVDQFPNLVILIPPQAASPSTAQFFTQAGQKFAVQVDTYPNLAIRGSNQPPPGQRIDTVLGQVKANVYADQFPNLVIRQATVQALPVGQRVDQSAPITKYQVQVDQSRNLVLAGSNQLPVGQRLDTSAPIVKYEVRAEQFVNLPGNIPAPLPRLAQVTQAPQGYNVYADVLPNLAILAPSVSPFIGVVVPDFDQYQAKYQVYADQPPNVTIHLIIPVIPPGQRLDQGVAATKYQVTAEQQPNVTIRLFAPPPPIPLPLSAVRSDYLQYQGKYAVQVDIYPNLVLRGSNQPPVGGQLDRSAPATKYQVQIDYPTNQLVLKPQVVLPPGSQLSNSAPQVAGQYRADVFPNLVLQLPPVQPVTSEDFGQFQGKAQVYTDQFVNLLPLRTVVQTPLPPGQQLSTSAPPNKFQASVDLSTSLVLHGSNQPPPGQQMSVITTYPPIVVTVTKDGSGFNPAWFPPHVITTGGPVTINLGLSIFRLGGRVWG